MENEEFWIEHDIFWMLVKWSKVREYGRLYLAIQAGIAFKAKYIDAGQVMSEMLAEGHGSLDGYCFPCGGQGLAIFSHLYDWQVVEIGETDYHTVRFTRRYDGKTILVRMKLYGEVGSQEMHADLMKWKKKVDAKRDQILVKTRWSTHPFDPTR